MAFSDKSLSPFLPGVTGMNLKKFVFAAILLFISTGIVFAQPPAGPAGRVPVDIDKDIYVILYKKRVEISNARVEYARAHYDRNRRLLQSNAVSREEYELSAAAVAVQNAILAESNALLDIARARRETGLDVPIFPHQSGDAYVR